MNLSPQFLEAVNGFLAVEFTVILWMFMRYIVQGFYVYGWREGRHRRAAAIAIFVLIFGDLTIRLSIWWWRHSTNTGHPIDKDLDTLLTLTTTVGVIIASTGAACIIREFSPERWGEWPWAITMAVGLGTAVYLAM